MRNAATPSAPRRGPSSKIGVQSTGTLYGVIRTFTRMPENMLAANTTSRAMTHPPAARFSRSEPPRRGGEELEDPKEHTDDPDGDHRSDEDDGGPDVHARAEIARTVKVAPLRPISAIRLRFVRDRVLNADFRKRLATLATGDTGAAVHGAVPIARPRDLERDVHLEAHPDDLFLRFAAQRDQDLDGRLVVRPQAEVEHAVEEIEELRARVRERFRIDAVVTADQVARRVELRIVPGEAVEDQVPSRDVSLRGVEEDAVLKAFLSKVVDLFQERQIHMADWGGLGLRGQRADGSVLSFRPAEVVERERSDVPALFLRPPQCNGRINAAGQEDDRPFHSVPAKSFGPAASHGAGREAEASAP